MDFGIEAVGPNELFSSHLKDDILKGFRTYIFLVGLLNFHVSKDLLYIGNQQREIFCIQPIGESHRAKTIHHYTIEATQAEHVRGKAINFP